MDIDDVEELKVDIVGVEPSGGVLHTKQVDVIAPKGKYICISKYIGLKLSYKLKIMLTCNRG